MPPRPKINILRNIRLQLKTGYLREEPIEYQYMKRHPPLSRSSVSPYLRVNAIDVPYLGLYNKAIAKNPLYQDERVYGAYSQQLPQALILAKKQYQYMQEGLTEIEAYNKAMKYVSEMENKAYLELKRAAAAVDAATGSKPAFVTEESTLSELSKLQERLSNTHYDDLSLAEQGAVDKFVQNKILKWNEVERERRMKDPIFVSRFNELLKILFPVAPAVAKAHAKKFQDKFKQNFLALNNYHHNRMVTAQPFYVEDYLKFYSKLMRTPNLLDWKSEDREKLSKWIVETLAYQDATQRGTTKSIQKYLDGLRDSFFPMIRFPKRVSDLPVLNMDKIKLALYQNEIGYQRQDEKIYVKRFYRLPNLFFTREILCSSIISNPTRLNAVLADDNALLQEIVGAGLDGAILPEVRHQLEDYKTNNHHSGFLESLSEETDSVDMSILDDILGEINKDKSATASASAIGEGSEPADGAEGEKKGYGNMLAKGSAQWEQFVKDQLNTPTNELEQDREMYFLQFDSSDFESLETLEDVDDFKNSRIQTELIVRAKLIKQYEQKESARQTADWENRKIWKDELPFPTLPLVEKDSLLKL